MLTKVIALRHDKLHGCRSLMCKVILGESSLNSWTRNTRGGAIHHHDPCIFHRLFDDGAIVSTNHRTLDDCTRRPRLLNALITDVSSSHEVVAFKEGCREDKTKCVHCDLEVDGTVPMVSFVDRLDVTTRKPRVHCRVNRGSRNTILETNLRTP